MSQRKNRQVKRHRIGGTVARRIPSSIALE
jgi:hypothetical protein